MSRPNNATSKSGVSASTFAHARTLHARNEPSSARRTNGKPISHARRQSSDRGNERWHHSHSHHHGPGGPVDLESTLSQFDVATGFDVQKYITDRYRQVNPSTSVEHLHELKLRRDMTSEALRGYVTRHYDSFIETSREIVHIENDMIQLNHMLTEFQSAMKSLQSVSLSYDDENAYIKKQQEKENQAVSRAALSSSVRLDSLNESLRSAIYERKYEAAVAVVEDIYERWRIMEKANASSSPSGRLPRNDDEDQDEDEMDENMEIDQDEKRNHANQDDDSTCSDRGLRAELLSRISTLISMLMSELRSSHGMSAFESKVIIGYLIRLQQADTAMQVFLQQRSSLIASCVRQVRYQGDVSAYIKDLSTLVFRSIQSACTEFQRLFGEYAQGMMSGMISWTLDELQAYALIFKKQVFLSEDTFAKLGRCLRYAYQSCHALEKRGLSLCFVLARLFTPSLLDVIKKNYKHVESLIADELAVEEWHVTELWVHDPNAEKKKGKNGAAASKRALKLTASAKYLYDVVRNLLHEIVPILDNQIYPAASNELYPTVVQGMISLFEGYLLTMAQHAKQAQQHALKPSATPTLDDIQSLSIVANAYYLADDLLPRVTREFVRSFGRGIPELDAFRTKLTRLHAALQDSFVQKRAIVWVRDLLQFESLLLPTTYTSTSTSTSTSLSPSPSPPILTLITYLTTLHQSVLMCLHQQAVNDVMRASLLEIMDTMVDILSSDDFPTYDITYTGLQQFVIDIRYIIRSSGEYAHQQNLMETVSTLIKRMYSLYGGHMSRIGSKKEKLQDVTTYDNIVDKWMKKHPEQPNLAKEYQTMSAASSISESSPSSSSSPTHPSSKSKRTSSEET